MSLFGWSAPERRIADRILPDIPNEIFFKIFQYLAPPTRPLGLQECRIYATLSLVCKSFANFCLPLVFECIKLSRPVHYHERDPPDDFGPSKDGVYRDSTGTTLVSHIVAEHPLALSLAKTVRVCNFNNLQAYEPAGEHEIGTTPNQHLSGILHMTNLCELEFAGTSLDVDHWRTITAMQSLKELRLCYCEFPPFSADWSLPPAVLQVPRLKVTHRTGDFRPLACIHAPSLRTLIMDVDVFEQVRWLRRSALSELQVTIGESAGTWPQYTEQVYTILQRTPPSVESLSLHVRVSSIHTEHTLQHVFATPGWLRFSALRFLILHVQLDEPFTELDILPAVLRGVNQLKSLRSVVVKHSIYYGRSGTSLSDVRRMLHDKLDPDSSLLYVDFFGIRLHLEDGEWSDSAA